MLHEDGDHIGPVHLCGCRPSLASPDQAEVAWSTLEYHAVLREMGWPQKWGAPWWMPQSWPMLKHCSSSP